MAKRRFQKGSFQLKDGKAYSLFYEDVQQSDGLLATRRVRHFIGRVPDDMSKRAIMQEVNRKRGSVAPAVKGRTFLDSVNQYRREVAPLLSPSTVRQQESYLKMHILPRFKDFAPHGLDVQAMQQFTTDLRKTLSRKTIINILGTVFAVLDYAERCGVQVSRVSFKSLKLGSNKQHQQPFFTGEQVRQIIRNAEEPFKTIFTLAYLTGMRAGEILALQFDDLDFSSKTIRVNKTADDNTREIRQPKTEASTAFLSMPSALEEMLNNYLEHHWKPNSRGFLFPAPRKPDAPRSRDNVVRCGLKPVLRKLGIPTKNTGLHAFRHALATNLAERSVPLTVLRQQMRHKDERTTLRIYAYVIPAQHREVMEQVGNSLNWNKIGTGTEKELQVIA